MKDHSGKLNALAFGLSMGAVYALSIFVMGMLATHYHVGVHFVDLMSEYYSGYSLGLSGSLVGAFWGLVDGFIMGFLVGFFYNFFHGYCKGCC